jgi:hypothetical protein
VKIYRGGKASDNWEITDSKNAEQVADDWAALGHIQFDGTIDKAGERHTDLGIQISEEDVLALFKVLLPRIEEAKHQLSKEVKEKSAAIEALLTVLRKIDGLIWSHENKAPSRQALISAVREIAEHYSVLDNLDMPPPEPKWIKWSEI